MWQSLAILANLVAAGWMA